MVRFDPFNSRGRELFAIWATRRSKPRGGAQAPVHDSPDQGLRAEPRWLRGRRRLASVFLDDVQLGAWASGLERFWCDDHDAAWPHFGRDRSPESGGCVEAVCFTGADVHSAARTRELQFKPVFPAVVPRIEDVSNALGCACDPDRR